MEITQAVILAGGQGKRLQPFTKNNPKPMVRLNGKPFLWYLIQLLKENGIKEIVILTGYLGEKIEKYFGNGASFGIKNKYSYTPFLNEAGEENMSGIRLKNASKFLNNFFILLYCDNYWPFDLNNHLNYYKKHPSDVLITVFSNWDNSTKNNLYINSHGYVTKYDKSRKSKNLNAVDIGFFIVNKKVLKLLPKSNSSFEMTLLPNLISEKRLSGLITNRKYYSIGDNQRIKITEKFLNSNKIIILDRDGVINKKAPKADYIKKWGEFEFLPDIIKALKLLKSNGYKLYIVSNQAGIARGMMSESNLKQIHKNMLNILKKNGVTINGIYYCPHGWDEGCFCRKPKPGMLLQASKDHIFDLTKAYFIGDDERDLEAGNAAGCKTILINEKNNILNIVKYILSLK